MSSEVDWVIVVFLEVGLVMSGSGSQLRGVTNRV